MKQMFVAAALLVAAGACSAQGYVGALAGLTKVSSNCRLPGVTCDDSDKGYKVYGGYSVNPNVAIELGYTSFGKLKMSGPGGRADIKGTAVSLVSAFRGQFSNAVTGVARLGVAGVNAKVSSNIAGLGDSEDNVKLYAGLGLEYALAKNFNVNAAVDYTDVEYSDERGSAYLVGVGLQYGF